MLAGEVGAYSPPGAPAIFGFKEHIGGIKKKMRIDRRKNNRLGTVHAIIAANWDRRDILNLPGTPVEARDFIATGAVNDVVVQRIRRDIAVLNGPNRVPVSKCDFAVIAAGRSTNRTAL